MGGFAAAANWPSQREGREAASRTTTNLEIGGRFRSVAQGDSWDAFSQLLSDSLLGILMWPQIPDLEASKAITGTWNSTPSGH